MKKKFGWDSALVSYGVDRHDRKKDRQTDRQTDRQRQTDRVVDRRG